MEAVEEGGMAVENGLDRDVIIQTENLTKCYGEKRAVSDLTLSIRRGEVFGLLGPNGAGKTTTILMLLGLTEPDGAAPGSMAGIVREMPSK